MMHKNPGRREALKNILIASTAVAISPTTALASCATNRENKKLKGNIKHAVCRWTYSFLTVDELCREVKNIGFSAIDLVGPEDWNTLKKYGIYSSMCNGAEISLTKGWNRKEYHPTLINNYLKHIDLVSAAGYKNLICFSGNKEGMDDETGLKNCVEGLKQILPAAEKKGVVIQMELLNSKVNHIDYMCDHSAWGVELVKRLGSENFKLLYDIYHMQIDEGDVIHTIQQNHTYYGHYHTGGVPGRHIIDETQELYYPAIMRAILATGFNDYVAQEFVPQGKENKEKVAQLVRAVHICDV